MEGGIEMSDIADAQPEAGRAYQPAMSSGIDPLAPIRHSAARR
jgi:hypothetical protein